MLVESSLCTYSCVHAQGINSAEIPGLTIPMNGTMRTSNNKLHQRNQGHTVPSHDTPVQWVLGGIIKLKVVKYYRVIDVDRT